MNILKEIYKTLVDFVKDLRSTRNQLIWIATGLFIYSVIKGVDAVTLGIVAGLLTIVYTYYFASKNNEHKQKHELEVMDKTVVAPRGVDPDDI